MPDRGLNKPKPVVTAWMFGSVTMLVTVNCVNSFTVCVLTGDTPGAMFASLTITVKKLTAVNSGLTGSNGSRLTTTTVTVLVLGLWLCAGIHVKMPLLSMFIPGNGLIRA